MTMMTKRNQSGFTLLELLLTLILGTVVVSAAYQLLIGQNRLYLKQREVMDVRGTLRGMGNLLTFELRNASAQGGDLYSITPDSFTIRSLRGFGVVCSMSPGPWRFGLWGTMGELLSDGADSVLVFASGGASPADDRWFTLAVENVWAGAGAGISNCDWNGGSGTVPAAVVQVDSAGNSLHGIRVGAPLRAFRQVRYGIFQRDGRWWLGRKVGAADSYQLLGGPLRPPADGGLTLTYYDQLGNVTTDPGRVRYVDIRLRGESLQAAPQSSGAAAPQVDTLTVRTTLRSPL